MMARVERPLVDGIDAGTGGRRGAAAEGRRTGTRASTSST